MRQTITQTTRDVVATPPGTWFAKVSRVDWASRTLDVNLDGSTGLSFVRVADNIELGTEKQPNILPGDEVEIKRASHQVGNSNYVATAHFRNLSSTNDGAGGAIGVRSLAAPEWIKLQVIGTILEGSWTPVAGSSYYQLFSNSVNSANGASLVAQPSGTQYTANLNSSASAQILTVNPGAESGGTAGWVTDPIISISASVVHLGSLAFRLDNRSTGTEGNLYSQYYPIAACSMYTFSFWHNILDAAASAVNSVVYWADSACVAISQFNVFASAGSTADWVQRSASGTSPSNASFVKIAWGAAVAATLAYADDFSIIGAPITVNNNLLYAVRAVDAIGNTSPFSTWLQATQSPAALGSPASPHSLLDYANAAIQSSDFITGASGYKVSPSGIDGNFIHLPPRIQSGSVNCNTAGSAVVFGSVFGAPPAVTLTTSGSTGLGTAVGTVTASGFTAYAAIASAIKCYWTAMGV